MSLPVAQKVSVFLEHHDGKQSFQIYSGIHALLPDHFVLVVLQNLVRPFLLEDHCGVPLILRYLARFGQTVGFQHLFLPTLQKRLYMGI